MHAKLVFPLLEHDGIRSKRSAFRADVDRGGNSVRRVQSQVDRKLLARETHSGETQRFQPQGRLRTARERDRIDWDSQTLGLPGGSRNTARIFFAVRDVGVLEVFVGDRREQDEPGRFLAVVPGGRRNRHEALEVRLELAKPRRPGKRLVEAEGGDQDIGLFILERVTVVVEMGLARPQGQLVGRISEVVDHQFEVDKTRVQ